MMPHTSPVSTKSLARSMEAATAISRRPGVFGPSCGQHVGIETNKYFFQNPIDDATGTPFSAHDAFVDWAMGADVELIDTAIPTLSTCP